MRYVLIGANLACVVANLLVVSSGGSALSAAMAALSAFAAGFLIGQEW